MDPTLWHVTISHFSEKARWALDHKAIPYRLRAADPGIHMLVAIWLTRGRNYTLPVLGLDGDRIGDSTAIIAALERHYPDPPLYPADPAQRARALELETFFDEQLGPYVRRFVFHELLSDPTRFAEVGAQAAPRVFHRLGPGGQRALANLICLRYRAHSDDGADTARAMVKAAFDRLEAELGDHEYLVADTFTVADLTAAALLYPLVRPPEAYIRLGRMPARVEELHAELCDRPGYQWVEEMFRRHR